MFDFFRIGKIFEISSKLTKYVFVLFIIVLTIGLSESLFLSPEDYKQSHAVRIMYVHVPAAWMALGIFSMMTFLSVGTFIFKNKKFYLISKSLAPSGFIFNIIALITGSIWGKPTWGTWWVWDARITSMLILFLFYFIYLVSFSLFKKSKNLNKISSIIAILGLINIPIIKFSVEWWSTLHQPSSVKILSETSIHNSMLLPLLIMTASFALFSLLIFLMKYNTELIKLRNKRLDRL